MLLTAWLGRQTEEKLVLIRFSSTQNLENDLILLVGVVARIHISVCTNVAHVDCPEARYFRLRERRRAGFYPVLYHENINSI